MVIYLLRHGETQWNRQRRLQGQLDSSLTARGIAQARAMGATLRQLLGDEAASYRMVCSPLGRAREAGRLVPQHSAAIRPPSPRIRAS